MATLAAEVAWSRQILLCLDIGVLVTQSLPRSPLGMLWLLPNRDGHPDPIVTGLRVAGHVVSQTLQSSDFDRTLGGATREG